MRVSTFPGRQPDTIPGQESFCPATLEVEPPRKGPSKMRNTHLHALPGDRIAEGNIKRIHVDQHAIKASIKTGEQQPCITVQLSSGPIKCHEVAINGPSKMVARLDAPLSCGARIWIETNSEVEVVR